MPDWENQSGIFLFLETQALRLYNRLFRGLGVTSTHGLNVKVDDLLAFLAEDVGNGLLDLLHGDAEIRHRGTQQHHVGTGLQLFGNLVGVEGNDMLKLTQLSVDLLHIGIIADVDEGVIVGDSLLAGPVADSTNQCHIGADGIEINSGNLAINTGGDLTVSAGGVFDLSALGPKSSIIFGTKSNPEEYLAISAGGLVAQNAIFASA